MTRRAPAADDPTEIDITEILPLGFAVIMWVAWRRARFARLMAEEPWRALYGRLLLAPPSRILSPADAETIWKPWARAGTTKG